MFDNNSTDTTFLYELARDSDTSEIIGYLKNSEDPAIRARAAEILGDFSDVPQDFKYEEIVRELVGAALQDDNEKVRAMAIDSLYRHGEDSLERLIDDLSERDIDEAPDWVVAETLIEWLDSEHAEFRLVAATALGDFGDEEIVPQLVDRFTDSDARVRMRAARACGNIGDERCIGPLKNLLEDRRAIVRREAAYALANIGTEQALEALVPVAQADDEQLRQIAIDSLGEFNNLKPLVVLVKALDDRSGAVRRTAVVSLIELFAEAPDSVSEQIRSTVAEQLESVDSVDVVPPLVDILNESDRWVIRRNAIWLLGQVADDRHEAAMFDCLIDALDDTDVMSGQLAASTLIDIADTVDSEEMEKQLRLYIQNGQCSTRARRRAEYVVDEISPDVESELVSTSVDYTYVREPADYTRKKRNEES
jgi:HEAT repeat protein